MNFIYRKQSKQELSRLFLCLHSSSLAGRKSVKKAIKLSRVSGSYALAFPTLHRPPSQPPSRPAVCCCKALCNDLYFERTLLYLSNFINLMKSYTEFI